VFDLHIYKVFRATCNEVAMCFDAVATASTFSVSDIGVPGKRYHCCIFSEGTVRPRDFFSCNKP